MRMTIQEARQYLDSFINYELFLTSAKPGEFKLARVNALLSLVDHPEKKLKCLHVAGSKGKGSTCACLAHILRSAGYRVGLYTSPHIRDVRERVRVLTPQESTTKIPGDIFPDNIPAEDFCLLLEDLQPHLEAMRQTDEFGKLSYFEVLTALAFVYFSRREVDFAVLETGLGGRLDATNVVEPLVCGITPIDLEHTRQLGTTHAAIAGEKAAIIKPGTTAAVIAPQVKEAQDVIEEQCRRAQVPCVRVGEEIDLQHIQEGIDGQKFYLKTPMDEYELQTRLVGRHQVVNAATAVAMVEAVRSSAPKADHAAIVRGVNETFWPGRFEIIQDNPFVILDGAHTLESARKFVKTLRHLFPSKRVILILGVSEDKDIAGIVRTLGAMTSEVILSRAAHPRAHTFSDEEVQDYFKGKEVYRADSPAAALQKALQIAAVHDVVCVAGSLYLMADVRECFPFVVGRQNDGGRKDDVPV